MAPPPPLPWLPRKPPTRRGLLSPRRAAGWSSGSAGAGSRERGAPGPVRRSMEREARTRLGQYELVRPVGKGSYGEVSLAKHRRDGRKYVIKKLNLRNASIRERKAAEQEAQLLSRLKHPNIVAYRESWEGENGLLYIVMDFCEGGDLYHKLKEQKGMLLDEKQVVEWFVQITMALQYLHKEHIMHRDLKTQNIFLTRTDIIKVGDLGIARVLENQQDMASTLIGTPYYMSPELFSKQVYNYKSDIWALGCCVYEMATLKHAFNAKDMNSLVFRIIEGKLPAMPKNYSPQLGELIGTMLSKDPVHRPDAKDILKRPYIKQHISLFLDNIKKRPVKKPKRTLQHKENLTEENIPGNERNVPQKQTPAHFKGHREQNRKKSPVKSKPVSTSVTKRSSDPEPILSLDKKCMSSTGVSIATLSRVDIDMSSGDRRGPRSDHLIQGEKQRRSSISDELGPGKKVNGPQLKEVQPHTDPTSNSIAAHDMAVSNDTLKLLEQASGDAKLSTQEMMESTEKLLEPVLPVSVPDGIMHMEQKMVSALQPNSSNLEPSISRQRKRSEQAGQHSEKVDAVSPRPLPSPPPSVKRAAVRKARSIGEEHSRAISDSSSISISSDVVESRDRPLSARERRRIRKSQEEMLPAEPRSSRASSLSACIESKSHLENEHVTKSRSSSDLALPPKPSLSAGHLSDDDFASSTSSTDKSEGDAREGKSDSSEMHDLVELMTQTLKLEAKDRCEPAPAAAPLREFKLHRKYRDTLILHGKVAEEPQEFRLSEVPEDAVSEKVRRTVESLRIDVVQGLGVKLLEKVYDIMNEEDEALREEHLQEHMGEKYANYGVKVRQLKFFEENVRF
ncbi:serine/threonine-protein kinase Nek4 [Ambystoma mexicanum]|uniref:serine/threonine-protein kinase Nek4 n=1 Tax=Ambystoma mexicanum TaxID=8296 RepID=UPI0037E98E48